VQFVDTHCHIQSAGAEQGERATRDIWAKDPELTGDMLVERSVQAGVDRLVCVGCDLGDSRLAIDFVQKHENCWASIGIHPHEGKEYAGKTELLAEFAALANEPKVIAVGECGFDFYYTHSPKEAQEEILRFQLDLASKNDLPVIFHVREAFDDFWPIFDSYQGIRGVLHSFTDSKANLDKALERGLYIGVNGIATFSKDPDQQARYKSVPLDHLLLETDAPFLTPTPYRGKINQPQHVLTIAEFLADLRGESLDSIAAATTHNASELFRI
jgi:TatD DNase family protein